MTTEKELLVMNKLEYLKEIRYRMQEIDRVRCSINEELDLVNVEEKCLQEYRREMDSLYQEKMTHVEELRQIHSDINMLENVLKQSEEDRNRHVDNVKRLHHHLQQMKDGVDKMRAEIGLPRLNENRKDQDIHLIDKLDLDSKRSNSYGKGEFELKTTLDPLVTKQITGNNSNKSFTSNTNLSTVQQAPGSGSFSSLTSLMSGIQEKHHQASNFNRLSLMGNTGTNNSNANSSSASSFHQDPPVVNASSAAAAAAAFRQQPPPMKSCLSCHQQIHRNAPICPLCKAKSRSRHPKRRANTKN